MGLKYFKYDVGDEVCVIPDLSSSQKYNGINCNHIMVSNFRGEKARITEKLSTVYSDEPFYKIDIDEGVWMWAEIMLEPCCSEIEAASECELMDMLR